MLEVVASFHCMQFHKKLVNQTLENFNKPGFASYFGPYSGHQNLFKKSSCQSLDIMVNYHRVQYQKKKLMIQSWENLEMDGWTN